MLPTVGRSLLVFASCAAFAQAPLSFDVASVKPAPPPTDNRIMRRVGGGPGSTDPGRITYSNVTLKMLVTLAYDLKDYQVDGPDWIDNLGYDIIATMPQGTTREQMAQMIQTLLTERFKLASHRETRQLPVFALVAAKGGPKLKEVEVPQSPKIPDGAPPAPANAVRIGGAGPDGGPPRLQSGPGQRMTVGPNGIQLAGYMTMAQLANQLTRQMGRPVLDQTELTKTYDVNMTWMPDDLSRGGFGGAISSGAGGDSPRPAAEPTATLQQALLETLGLRLDARKSTAEVLVIDRGEKVPVEN